MPSSTKSAVVTPAAPRNVVLKMEEEDTFDFSESNLFKNHDQTLLNVDPIEAERQVERALRIGDTPNAEYWTDRLFAVSWTKTMSSWTRYGKLVEFLARGQKYLRIIAICERYNLHMRHLFFMHFYVLALTERRLHSQAISVPCAQFLREDDSIDLTEVPLILSSSLVIPDPEFSHEEDDEEELDIFAMENNLRSGLLLSLGRSFLQTENRAAAAKCLLAAHRLNKANLMAENLLTKFNLLCVSDRDEFEKYRQLRRDSNATATQRDPRELVLLAGVHYDDGDILAANKMTTKLIDTMGLYQDALLLHIATLVQLNDADRLFLLAHRLVDAQPDCEISWYAVSLYYFVCKNIQAAKSFMNKATTMNECFGEGWLAFGHILAFDCEHEQAMNCYLRAARVLEARFEPLLYIAMGHCYTNNLKLALDFIQDATTHAGNSPLLWHEKGTIMYTKNQFSDALDCYMRALTIVTKSTAGDSLEKLLEKPLDSYWEPLVNNLGHVNRKMMRFADAVICHRKALLLVPQKTMTLTALGLATASLLQYSTAANYFHQALAIKPFCTLARLGFEAMISEENTLTLEPVRNKNEGAYSISQLSEELDGPRDPFMDKANKMVTERRKRDFMPRKHPSLRCGCEECTAHNVPNVTPEAPEANVEG